MSWEVVIQIAAYVFAGGCILGGLRSSVKAIECRMDSVEAKLIGMATSLRAIETVVRNGRK